MAKTKAGSRTATGHKTKQGAISAARKALGPEAVEGADFSVANTGSGFTFKEIAPAPAKRARAPKKAAAKAEAEPKVERRSVAETAKTATKAEAVLRMLNRPKGASMSELMSETGWQPHSVRGFIAGTVKGKLGYSVEATRGDQTSYRITGRVESAPPASAQGAEAEAI